MYILEQILREWKWISESTPCTNQVCDVALEINILLAVAQFPADKSLFTADQLLA